MEPSLEDHLITAAPDRAAVPADAATGQAGAPGPPAITYPAYGRELPPAALIARHARLWVTINRDFGDLPLARRLQLADLVRGVCGACHDAEPDCRCWDRG